MSKLKTIKLSEETYDALDDLRRKRETFDEAVRRLLRVFREVRQVADTLVSAHPLVGRKSTGEKK